MITYAAALEMHMLPVIFVISAALFVAMCIIATRRPAGTTPRWLAGTVIGLLVVAVASGLAWAVIFLLETLSGPQ
jgi:hypothetical protein